MLLSGNRPAPREGQCARLLSPTACAPVRRAGAAVPAGMGKGGTTSDAAPAGLGVAHGPGAVPVVLAVSGHDPVGAAGIQADIEAVTAMGCDCASLVTALTAQNTARFLSLYPQSADALRRQADVLLEDIMAAAIKIGVVGTAAAVDTVAAIIERAGSPAVVLDPVLRSGTGGELADPECRRRLLQVLVPRAAVITPNCGEALALTGAADVDAAARALLERGCRAVLVTGLDAAECGEPVLLARLYRPAGLQALQFSVPRLAGRYHGSGCTLSAALSACLARGHSLPRSVRIAMHYTWECLRAARRRGRGQRHPERFAGAPRTPAPRLRPGLYAIADAGTLPAAHLAQATAKALRGGAVAVQYRDKDGVGSPRLARELLHSCRRHGACFIVNDDPALARELGADGVHLGRGDADPAAARAVLGQTALVGVSCYDSLERARAAERVHADYVAFGSFFPSATRPAAVRPPLSLLREARRSLSVPIVAIGGMTVERAPRVLAAGADLVASIRDLYLHPSPGARAGEYARLFPASWIP